MVVRRCFIPPHYRLPFYRSNHYCHRFCSCWFVLSQNHCALRSSVGLRGIRRLPVSRTFDSWRYSSPARATGLRFEHSTTNHHLPAIPLPFIWFVVAYMMPMTCLLLATGSTPRFWFALTCLFTRFSSCAPRRWRSAARPAGYLSILAVFVTVVGWLRIRGLPIFLTAHPMIPAVSFMRLPVLRLPRPTSRCKNGFRIAGLPRSPQFVTVTYVWRCSISPPFIAFRHLFPGFSSCYTAVCVPDCCRHQRFHYARSRLSGTAPLPPAWLQHLVWFVTSTAVLHV